MVSCHPTWRMGRLYLRQHRSIFTQALRAIAIAFLSSIIPQQRVMACTALPVPGTWVALGNGNYHTVATPSAAVFDGNVYLAWTANNASRNIIVAKSCNGLDFSTYVVSNFTTNNSGPGLAAKGNHLYMAWAGAGNHKVFTAFSTNGLDFVDPEAIIEGPIGSNPPTSGIVQSYAGVHLGAAVNDGTPALYAAWAGVDEAHTYQMSSATGSPATGGLVWATASGGGATPSLIDKPTGSVSSSSVTVKVHSCTSYNLSCALAEVFNNIGDFINLGGNAPVPSVDGPTFAVGPSSNILTGGVVLAPTVPGQDAVASSGYIKVLNGIYLSVGPNLGAAGDTTVICRAAYSPDSDFDDDCSHVTSNAGIGLAVLNSVLYVAWVPAGQKDIYINGYSISGKGRSISDYSTAPFATIATGHPCEGNPTLITFDGHVYLYWMATNSGTNVLGELVPTLTAS